MSTKRKTTDGGSEPNNLNAEVAENYIASELLEARKTLTWTRIVSTVLVVGALFETIFVAGGFSSTLQPRSAAQVADGIIAQKVADNTDDIKATIEEKIPQLISQVPDQAIGQLPVLRETLEKNFETSLTSYASDSSKNLDAQLSDYLDSHKDQVGAALSSGQDPAVIHALASGMTDDFVSSLQDSRDEDGESTQNKIDWRQTKTLPRKRSELATRSPSSRRPSASKQLR